MDEKQESRKDRVLLCDDSFMCCGKNRSLFSPLDENISAASHVVCLSDCQNHRS